MSVLVPLLIVLACGDGSAAPPVVHPTLEEIFKPPRLLGVRPRELSLSADGEFVLWRAAAIDAEKLEFATWVARADGSGEPRELFPPSAPVETQWSATGSVLFLFRSGWIETLDLGGDGVERPLFECGSNRSGVQFTRDGALAIFVAGDDNELWVLDLATGERRSPARSLPDRTRWFEVREESGEGEIALFAGPEPSPVTPITAMVAAKAPEAKPTDGKAADGQGEKRPPRVLWFVPLRGEGAPRKTALVEGDRISISADGRYAVLAHLDFEAKRQLVLADYLTETVSTVPVRNDLAGDPPAKQRLLLFDLSSGVARPPAIDEGERFLLLDAEWSLHGSRLLVHRMSGDAHVRQLLVVDPEGDADWLVQPLFSERDDAWIGGPLLFAQWTDEGAVVFSSEQSGFAHLYRAADGVITPLTSGGFEVQSARLLDDEHTLLVRTNERDPAERSLRWIDTQSGESRPLETPRGCVGEFAASRDGRRVAFLQEELGVPGDVHALATEAGAKSVQLSDTVTDGWRELALSPPEVVEFTNSADATRLRALLYRPQPFDPAATYPAVVFVHGAGYLQNVTRSMTEYPSNYLFHERLARQGFVVLDVDYRHSAGYGRKFRTDIYGFMGGKDLDDEIAGVDYLKSLGCVDAGRIGLYGGSYGGFMTLMALFTKPDVFACGAALRSVTDWRTYNTWYTTPRLGDPKKDAENYRRSSPIDHAEGLKKPLLLLHGMKDSNVFAQDSIRLIEKLIQLGKEFDVMLYPSQDHAFTDPESWIDEYKRIERLFVRELRPTAAPLTPRE